MALTKVALSFCDNTKALALAEASAFGVNSNVMTIDKAEFDRLVLEAGEDEEQAEDDASQQPEENEGSDEDSKSNAEAEDAVEDVDKPFSGLDLRAARCFGYRVPKEKCWECIAKQSEDVGWNLVDKEQLEKSLAKDVEDSYMKIAEFKLVDVDDDMAYSLWFDNNKALWGVGVLDSPKAEMTIEERADFFKSDMFQKIAKKTYYRILNAQQTFNSDVKPHIDEGELLLVDAVKLDAIMHFLDLDYFLKNLLNGKYLSY